MFFGKKSKLKNLDDEYEKMLLSDEYAKEIFFECLKYHHSNSGLDTHGRKYKDEIDYYNSLLSKGELQGHFSNMKRGYSYGKDINYSSSTFKRLDEIQEILEEKKRQHLMLPRMNFL